MSEWSTYTPADFLMFSSRTYWRLVALYNEAVRPWQLLAIVAGGIVVGCLARPTVHAHRIAMLLLAAAWAWVAWAYHLARYADISTAGPYFAGAFALQALLLGGMGVRASNAQTRRLENRAGLAIAGLAVFAYPLLVLAGGRPWRQAELFGIAPDPTVIATLGVLLAARIHWSAWLIPLAWCVVNAATLMALRVGHAWVLPACAVLAVAVGVGSRRAGGRH